MGLWRQTEIAEEAGKEVGEARSNAEGTRISRRCKRQSGGVWEEAFHSHWEEV